MRKYLAVAGNIAKYTFIYLVLQMAAGIIMGIAYTIKYIDTLTEAQIQEKLMEDIFIGVGISAICALLIYMLLFRNKEENLWERCKFKKMNLQQFFFTMLAALGLSAISSSFVLITYEKFESYAEVSRNIHAGLNTLIGTICIIVLIPIFEEILFRGLVLNELKRCFGIAISVGIQSVIFALYHGNLLQGIYTFALGIILGLIYIWFKNIWIPVLMHVSYNFLGTIVFPVLLYYTEKFVAFYILTGILALSLSLFYLYRRRMHDAWPEEASA